MTARRDAVLDTASTATAGAPQGELAGLTVAVTRPERRAHALRDALQSAGARVLFVPCIEIVPPASYAALDACLARMESYDWLLFTSVAAIDAVAVRLAVDNERLHHLLDGTPRIAVVADTTAGAAMRLFGRVDHVGEGDAESLATSLPVEAGERVLFVCSDRARDVLPSILSKRGARLDRAVGYCTRSVDAAVIADTFRRTPGDLVVVCSPSSVEVMASVAAMDDVSVPPAVCIGHVTAACATASGLNVVGVALRPSDDELLDATIVAARFHRSQRDAVAP